jgi:hypothetical protein
MEDKGKKLIKQPPKIMKFCGAVCNTIIMISTKKNQLDRSKLKNRPRLVCGTGLGLYLLFSAESSPRKI